MILLVELFFNGGASIKRVATEFYYSKYTDSIGVKEFAGRVTGAPTYRSSSGCIIWNNKSTTSIGDIEITNVDGGISDWVDLDFRDSTCVLRMVAQDASYDTSVIVQRCIVDDVIRSGQSVIVKLRGTETLLERSIQTLLFTSSSAAENQEIIGNTVPILIGRCNQVEPALTSTQDLAYQMSDSLITVDTVYSGGSIANSYLESPDDYAVNDTGFVMLNQPSARITADGSARSDATINVASNFNLSSEWSGSTPVNWVINAGPSSYSRVTDVGIRLVNLLSSNYPTMDSTAFSGFWHYVVGEIAELESGGIIIDFGDSEPTVVKRKGRFTCVGKCGTGGTIQIRALADTDVTIKFVYTYKFATDSSDYDIAQKVLEHILIRGGMRTDGSDSSLYDIDIGTPPSYRMGVYIDDDQSAAKILQMALDSYCAFVYPAASGVLKIGRYKRPSGTPTLSVSRLNMTRYPMRKTDLAPGFSTRFAAGRNWSPYTDNELAGITYGNRPPFMADYRHIVEGSASSTIDKVYSHGLQANPIETILCDEGDAQTEADRVCEIAQDKHPFWDIEFALNSVSDIADIRQETIVLLNDELFGDDNGKIAVVVEVDGRFGSNIYRIVTWGAESP